MAYINILDIIYPIGSFYFSANTQSPAEIVGGTWEVVPPSRYLLAGDPEYNNATTTGGNTEITIGINNMPSHTHTISTSGILFTKGGGVLSGSTYTAPIDWGPGLTVAYTGGGSQFRVGHLGIISMFGEEYLKSWWS